MQYSNGTALKENQFFAESIQKHPILLRKVPDTNIEKIKQFKKLRDAVRVETLASFQVRKNISN